MESIYCILKNFRCTYLRSWNWFVCTGSAPLPPDIQQDQVFTVQYLFTFSKAGLCVQVVHHYLQTASRTKSVLYSTCLPSWNWFVWTSCEPLPPDSQQNHVCTVQYLFTLLKLVTVCTGCAPLPVDSQQDQVCTVHCTVYVYLAQTGLCVQVMHHYLPDSQQDHVCTVQFLFTLLKLVCVYRLCTTTSRQPAGPSLHCTVLVYLAETGLRVQVVHHYLQTASRTMQSRLRKRGRMGKWSYIHTIRKQEPYTVTMQNIYYVFLDQGKMKT